MPWTRRLAKPIALKDGRTLATLADARAIVEALPERQQRNEHWLYAGGLLLEAAIRQGPMKITAAQLTRALKAEGLI
ncbi:MAG: hypothetical protein ABSE69_20230 [Roseiarcus sp.]